MRQLNNSRVGLISDTVSAALSSRLGALFRAVVFVGAIVTIPSSPAHAFKVKIPFLFCFTCENFTIERDIILDPGPPPIIGKETITKRDYGLSFFGSPEGEADPDEIKEVESLLFKTSYQFDPSIWELERIDLNPAFSQIGQFDLTDLTSGLIGNISGITTTEFTGNLASVILESINGEEGFSSFLFRESEGDFVQAIGLGGEVYDCPSCRGEVNQPCPVPGPLPLLGVGAAFGSIRKLRKFSSQLKTFSMN